MTTDMVYVIGVLATMVFARPIWRATSELRRDLGDRLDAMRRPARTDPEMDVLIYSLELRRLSEEVRRAHATDQPGKFLRVQASEGAYDDVLIACCRTVGVDPPAVRGPLTRAERFDVESQLLARDIEW